MAFNRQPINRNRHRYASYMSNVPLTATIMPTNIHPNHDGVNPHQIQHLHQQHLHNHGYIQPELRQSLPSPSTPTKITAIPIADVQQQTANVIQNLINFLNELPNPVLKNMIQPNVQHQVMSNTSLKIIIFIKSFEFSNIVIESLKMAGFADFVQNCLIFNFQNGCLVALQVHVGGVDDNERRLNRWGKSKL
ncbi:unnamed protein product [Ambrosiozyma monospora]|uniref:Unnamed protein product n=1 Tax=Ambrosiozyma monospora TaxID=43982 RepID=A0ACB5SSA7_AMBMO|nr:unnamed protein product [Ambrosiozyma monospora]